MRILLDLDDVLADCTGDAMRHMGLHDWERDDHAGYPRRDIEGLYQYITGIDFTPAQFWSHFNRKWWANLIPTPWCYDLIELCNEFADRNDIAILTSPTKCGDCLAGKMDWIETHMPPWLHRQYLMSPRKSFCAGPKNVLIDDCTENVDAFRSAGGSAIEFPQHWNSQSEHIDNELTVIRHTLESIRLRM